MKVVNQLTSIKIPAKPEYIGLARLLTAAYAGLLGFDNEAMEDIKIAVSEACTNAMLQLHKESHADKSVVEVDSYSELNKLFIDIKYMTKEASPVEKLRAQLSERDLGMSILTSIMDKVEIMKTKDWQMVLRLIKKIPD